MANEYATTAQLKTYLGITDSTDDTLLGSLNTAASRAIDNYSGQTFYAAAASDRQFLATDMYCLQVDPMSVTPVSVSIDYGQDGTFETTLTVTTQYIVEPYNGIVAGVAGFPYTKIRLVGGLFFPPAYWGRPQVKVNAAWGWATVPDPVYVASLQVAAEMWKRKDAPFGVLEGVEFGPLRLSADAFKSVSSLLRPYRTGSALAPMA
jgi:hypothetical protein